MPMQRERILLLVLLALGAPAWGQEKIKFTKKPLPKGVIVTLATTVDVTMKQSFLAEGELQEINVINKTKKVSVTTVLGVGDKGADVILIEFKTDKSTKKMSGLMESKDSKTSLLEGKKYKLSIKGTELVARTETGGAVSVDELAALKTKKKDLLKRGMLFDPHKSLGKAIGEREMTVGERIKLDQDLIGEVLGQEAAKQGISDFVLTLKGKKTVFGVSCAVFDVSMKLKFPNSKLKALDVEGTITGEWTIGIDTMWSHSIKLGGPLAGKGEIPTPQGHLALTVSGAMEMAGMSAYQVPKTR